MSDGPYKEKYRRDMIAWSEEVRRDDYGAFCREAMRKGIFIFLLSYFLNSVDINIHMLLINRIKNSTETDLYCERYPEKNRRYVVP